MRRVLFLQLVLALVLTAECGMRHDDKAGWVDPDEVHGPAVNWPELKRERAAEARIFYGFNRCNFRDKEVAGEDERKWFLTDEEITAARGGVSRSPMQVVTALNSVRPLIDGKRFMHELYADIESAQEGDYVHGTGFEIGGNIMLWPLEFVPQFRDDGNLNKSLRKKSLETSEKTTLHATLIRAIRRGVQVRMLVNKNVILRTAIMSKADVFCAPLNAASRQAGRGPCCVADDRHNGKGGSMHNKMWVMGLEKGRRVVAYVGGMDVGGMRFDDSKHQNGVLRKMQPQGLQPYFGWHDNMFRIVGPAATDLALHFYQRWNDEARPSHWLVYGMSTYYEPFEWVEPTPISGQGPLSIQVLRTLACKASAKFGLYRNFAPYGEYTFRAAFKKLVENAKEYLHLEDQFMFYPWALHLVRKALPRIQKVIIVTDSWRSMILRPVGPTVEMHQAAEMKRYYQAKAFAELLKPDADGTTYESKIHAYQLIRPGGTVQDNKDLIYLHSKNYIADDEYMIVGSAGIEEAGFTNDEELAIAIYDREKGKGPMSFVGQFRRRLWSEYAEQRVLAMKPIPWKDGLRMMEASAREESTETRLRPFWPESPVFDGQQSGEAGISSIQNPAEHIISAVYSIYENNGECNAEDIERVRRELEAASNLDESGSVSSMDSEDTTIGSDVDVPINGEVSFGPSEGPESRKDDERARSKLFIDRMLRSYDAKLYDVASPGAPPTEEPTMMFRPISLFGSRDVVTFPERDGIKPKPMRPAPALVKEAAEARGDKPISGIDPNSAPN